MPRINIGDISLNYEVDGKGPAVIFINGLTMDVNGWLLQVPDFSVRYRVIRYDCRGQGQSDKPDMEYSQEMHADDLKGLMERIEVRRAHIIGLSNGGMIAQHFAVKYPEKVGALVLVDTCSYIDTLLELTLRSWIKAAEVGGSELRYDVALPALFSEGFIKRNLENIMALREISIRNNPPKPVINLAKACLRHDISNRLSGIKAPTLIIVGEEDILIPQRYSRILHEGIKESKLVIMKECGHVPPIEKPEEFNRIVIGFLEEHDGLLEN
jgi:3-oxoadipate enol-lactonase